MRENETEEMEEQKHISERRVFRGGNRLAGNRFYQQSGRRADALFGGWVLCSVSVWITGFQFVSVMAGKS